MVRRATTEMGHCVQNPISGMHRSHKITYVQMVEMPSVQQNTQRATPNNTFLRKRREARVGNRPSTFVRQCAGNKCTWIQKRMRVTSLDFLSRMYTRQIGFIKMLCGEQSQTASSLRERTRWTSTELRLSTKTDLLRKVSQEASLTFDKAHAPGTLGGAMCVIDASCF